MFRNGFEPWHIAIIALVVLILFGSKKMPDAARSFGRSLRIFKAETKGLIGDHDDDVTGSVEEPDEARNVPPALPAARTTAKATDPAPATDSVRDQH